MTSSPISIKGRTSASIATGPTLLDVFQSHAKSTYSIEECVSYLRHSGIQLTSEALTRRLFGYRHGKSHKAVATGGYSFAGPFMMGEVSEDIVAFNMDYQNTVISLWFEGKAVLSIDARNKEPTARHCSLDVCLEFVARLLRTTDLTGAPLYLALTNSELDHLVLGCLDLLTPTAPRDSQDESLVAQGHCANRMALDVLHRLGLVARHDPHELVVASIGCGVVWWSDQEQQCAYFKSRDESTTRLADELSTLMGMPLAIDDRWRLATEVLEAKSPIHLLYVLDDNGELVADLLLIEAMLRNNGALRATAVVNQSPISNNANIATLGATLRDLEPWAPTLHSARFNVIAEEYGLPTLDLRFASKALLTALTTASHIFVKGASFFEKLQYLPAPSFYLFRTYSRMSCALSGLEKGSGVFARAAANARCFGIPVRCGDAFFATPNLKTVRQ